MAKVLYLVHRMPYPPDKGDKVRSYHVLKHLAERHRVFVGTFIDDAADEQHLPALHRLCAGVHAVRLHPRRARLASLAGLLDGRALTLAYYADTGLRHWVMETAARENFDAVVVFSSSMAPYAQALPQVPMLVDLVDVDSAKWAAYADHHRWPLSWLYRREARKLLAYERSVVAAARCSFLATRKEVELLLSLAPECAGRVVAMGNGVNADFFSPQADRSSPFAAHEQPVVFTGAMDYWPNIDAVCWFAEQVLPALRQRFPGLRLHIVGRSPTAAVKALQSDAVVVTGTVPDVRPYLQHAAVVVAPLRLARGIQNKVLEAMAMARPVVAAAGCVAATCAEPGREIVAADDASSYVEAIGALLHQPAQAALVGAAGRRRVLASYTWPAHMAVMEEQLQACVQGAAHAPAAPAGRAAAPSRLSEGIS